MQDSVLALQKDARNRGRMTGAGLCQAINWRFGKADTSFQVSHPVLRVMLVLLHASHYS